MKQPLIAIAAAAAAAVALAASPAAAEDVAIRYTDLNLATDAGQRVLEQRIEVAARRICGVDEQATGSRLRSRDAQRCYREAKTKATRQFAALVEEHAKGG